ncbi:hypothetical protein Lal_00011976 [Lupinus albus]|uniref:Putative transcription factor bHLH family n=1 Tax=Lupinus albus TaxID=3870 RepID=A0A6A5MRN1_LUPAL|nr:putative transcription factor bHLH family [Lupinus albus]KAF1877206.1 hypothetical protein Lal_00011976 [Lupinus albus]
MENHFFQNSMHFEPSPHSSIPMETHSSSHQNQDCFFTHPNISNDNIVIREFIGKLGTSYINGNNNTINNTPLSLNTSVEGFTEDRGFAARAAKLSCFGSKSFNASRSSRRSSHLVMNNDDELAQGSYQVMENVKILSRVSSSPSLKTKMMNSQDESMILDQNLNGDIGVKSSSDMMNSRKRKASAKGKAKETSISNKGVEGSEDLNAKRNKSNEGDGNENGVVKVEEEIKGDSSNSKPIEPMKDYIHVRARRGQATDSHSLAERARREKIGERMKLLQDLVPGCNKVIGKALMLDEIINYVQSLQHQVEFLSMKLSSVNTKMDYNIENLISKDIFQSNNSLANPIFQLDSSAQAFYVNQTQQDYNIPNGNVTHNSVETLDTTLCHINGFNESDSQYPLTFCEDDLNTIVEMGFGQIANIKTPSFNGSNQVSNMKLEL